MNLKSAVYSLFILMTALLSCKEGWLEAKPDKGLIIPRTIEDYQLLLNDRTIFGVNAPACKEIAVDDVYISSDTWKALDMLSRTMYIWASDTDQNVVAYDWGAAYERILHANIVLDGLTTIEVSGENDLHRNSVKGQALFYRARAFFQLSQLFCKPYNAATAETDLGIPLKLTAEVSEKVTRGTLLQTYEQIIDDLQLAGQLLPKTQEWKTMPTKGAASGLLARVYLTKGDYDAALKSANESLEGSEDLLDFNTLDSAARYPVPLFNKEVIWHAEMGINSAHSNLSGFVDTILYNSYAEHDLRRTLFFKEGHFRGSYTGSFWSFNGIAVDELLLIKAECLARKGEILAGMEVLNSLLRTRWRTDENGLSTFKDLTAGNELEALQLILDERRKELIMRGLRWIDLRRLNQDQRFQKTLVRKIDGKTYTLPPEDPRYTYPIPPDEVRLGDIEQNP